VGRLGYGQYVRLMTDEATNFHVDVPIAGHAEMSAGRAELVATQWEEAAVFSPGEPARMRWSDNCLQVCLMIPRASLDTQLEELIGRSVVRPLRFDFSMDLRGPIGRSWIDTVRLLARELDEGPGLLLHQYAGPHVQSLLLDGLLLGQPHSYSGEIGVEHDRGPLQPSPGPWISAMNARTNRGPAHRSPGRCTSAFGPFRKGSSETLANRPMPYLRDVRLRRVHGVLREARPGSVTVEAVASRWGVLHMSRWRAAYRVAFGEPPSSTLAR
jgi:hypothetical protein